MLQISKSKYSLGTKVARRFDGKMHEGEVCGYDAQESYYFIWYNDDDFEEPDCEEMAEAVQEHLQQVIAMLSQVRLATVGLRGAVAVLYSTGSSWSIRASNSRC
jgi:hypothetical protein